MLRVMVVALVVLAMCLGLTSCGKRSQPAGSVPPGTLAEQLVQNMVKGDFPAAVSGFDPTMRQALSAQELKKTWDSLIQQVGAFKSESGVQTGEEQGYKTVIVTCAFERSNINVKVAFDTSNQVSGLWFLPAS